MTKIIAIIKLILLIPAFTLSMLAAAIIFVLDMLALAMRRGVHKPSLSLISMLGMKKESSK